MLVVSKDLLGPWPDAGLAAPCIGVGGRESSQQACFQAKQRGVSRNEP